MNQLIEKAYAIQTQSYSTDLKVKDAGINSVQELVSNVAYYIGIIGGALAFIYLLYSGIMYITANGNPDQAKKAQTGILNAIIGLVIIVFAYAIFTAVNGTVKN